METTLYYKNFEIVSEKNRKRYSLERERQAEIIEIPDTGRGFSLKPQIKQKIYEVCLLLTEIAEEFHGYLR